MKCQAITNSGTQHNSNGGTTIQHGNHTHVVCKTHVNATEFVNCPAQQSLPVGREVTVHCNTCDTTFPSIAAFRSHNHPTEEINVSNTIKTPVPNTHGAMEINNLFEMNQDDLSRIWAEQGSHWCDLDYVGLSHFVRIRYVGDRMPLAYVARSIPKDLREWMGRVGYKGNTVLVLDFSYAFAYTRKGTLVRIQGSIMPQQIMTVSRDIPKAIEAEIRKALGREGIKKSTRDLRVLDAISSLT